MVDEDATSLDWNLKGTRGGNPWVLLIEVKAVSKNDCKRKLLQREVIDIIINNSVIIVIHSPLTPIIIMLYEHYSNGFLRS